MFCVSAGRVAGYYILAVPPIKAHTRRFPPSAGGSEFGSPPLLQWAALCSKRVAKIHCRHCSSNKSSPRAPASSHTGSGCLSLFVSLCPSGCSCSTHHGARCRGAAWPSPHCGCYCPLWLCAPKCSASRGAKEHEQ